MIDPDKLRLVDLPSEVLPKALATIVAQEVILGRAYNTSQASDFDARLIVAITQRLWPHFWSALKN